MNTTYGIEPIKLANKNLTQEQIDMTCDFICMLEQLKLVDNYEKIMHTQVSYFLEKYAED